MKDLRAIIIVCVTLVTLMVLYMFTQSTHQNFLMVHSPAEPGVYLFDDTHDELFHCDTATGCKRLLLPGQVDDHPSSTSQARHSEQKTTHKGKNRHSVNNPHARQTHNQGDDDAVDLGHNAQNSVLPKASAPIKTHLAPVSVIDDDGEN